MLPMIYSRPITVMHPVIIMAAVNLKPEAIKRGTVVALSILMAIVTSFAFYLQRRLEGICAHVSSEFPPSTNTEQPESKGFLQRFVSFLTFSWSLEEQQADVGLDNTRVAEVCSQSGGYFRKMLFILEGHLLEDFRYIMNYMASSISEQGSFHISLSLCIFIITVLLYWFIKDRKAFQQVDNFRHEMSCDGWKSSSPQGSSASLLRHCDAVFDQQIKVSNRGFRAETTTIRSLVMRLMSWSFVIFVSAAVLSVPWEFIRLYQRAVAERASKIIVGAPTECSPNTMTLYQSLKSVLRSHLSWSHGHDPCYDYHYALLVDPLWEVTPLMVLSSALTRCLLHPLELTSASLGRSLRHFFNEIPVQWQPLLMLIVVVAGMVLLLMMFRYRLSIPMFLKIEPKTPEHVRAPGRINTSCQSSLCGGVKRECICSSSRYYTDLRDTKSVHKNYNSQSLIHNQLRKTLYPDAVLKEIQHKDNSRADTIGVSHSPTALLTSKHSLSPYQLSRENDELLSTRPQPRTKLSSTSVSESQKCLFVRQANVSKTGRTHHGKENTQRRAGSGSGKKRTAIKKKLDTDPSWIPGGSKVDVVSDSE